MSIKPNIVKYMGRYVSLRRTGKEHIGRCPLHTDKNPSLSVNEEKGLFHCFGCGESGDVVDFAIKYHGLSFSEALTELGMNSTDLRRPAQSATLLTEIRKLASWSNEMTAKADFLLRKLGQKILLARQLVDMASLTLLEREWEMLEIIAEDLQHESSVLELYSQRDAIENILSDGIIEVPALPPLTAEYRRLLLDLPKPGSRAISKHE